MTTRSSPGALRGSRRRARPVAWLRRNGFPLALLAPAAVFCILMVSYPVVRTLSLSVHNGNLTRPRQMNDFVGTAHYQRLFADPNFWNALTNMLIYAFFVTVVAYAIGLGAALLVNQRSALTRWSRTLLTIPWAVPGVVAGFVFIWIFDASFGVVNYLVTRFGFSEERLLWLLRPNTAMAVIILSAVWKTVPFNMLTQLAGLQAIPDELREAARVDGATPWQEFWHIVWPGLSSIRTVAILLTTLHSFREFGQIYVITGGGPARSTETLSVQIYIESFSYFRFGYASAVGVVLLLIALLFTIVTVRSQRTRFF